MSELLNFAITGRHYTVTPSVQESAKTLCQELSEKYSVDFLDSRVTISHENSNFYTDIHIKTKNGYILNAKDNATEPLQSIDKTYKKIDIILCKKKSSNHKHNDNKRNFEAYVLEKDFEENNPIIIAEIVDNVQEMSVAQAASFLTQDKKLFAFKNVHTKLINVVYIRDDGNIGWVDANC